MEYSWIKTRDSSLTLWNNDLGEPFRSTKGAFTESFFIFAHHLRSLPAWQSQNKIMIAEFGLGPGTNWLLSAFLCHYYQQSFEYHVIEEREDIFLKGKEKWKEESVMILDFFQEYVNDSITSKDIDSFSEKYLSSSHEDPVIYQNPEEFLARFRFKADIWYHDPFALEVNPEGYSVEFFTQLKAFFQAETQGYSYACNKSFKENLLSAGFSFKLIDSSVHSEKVSASLKRQSLSFQL